MIVTLKIPSMQKTFSQNIQIKVDLHISQLNDMYSAQCDYSIFLISIQRCQRLDTSLAD